MLKPTLFAAILAVSTIPATGEVFRDVAMAETVHLTSTSGNRIDVETVVDAKLEDVWLAWTSDEGVRRFLGARTNIKLKIGGPFEILFRSDAPKGEQGSEGCKFLSYLPMEMVSFTWTAPPRYKHARKQHTWVVVRFQELEKNQVKVTLTHLGWDEKKAEFPEHAKEWDEVRDYFSKAWPSVLQRLQQRFRKK